LSTAHDPDLSAQTLLLFGATGDLALRMLLPSLYGLHGDGLLPADLRIVGSARATLDDGGFRAQVTEALARFLPAERLSPAVVASFLDRLRYVAMDVSRPSDFAALVQALPNGGGDPCRLGIFLSTTPSLYTDAINGLAGAGLAHSGVRLALEKPLGHDLASSHAINDAVRAIFPEERTFRIDHYLGKETVQNLLALRFGNRLFEPLWNADAIAHVQITAAETVGLEGRGEFYDGVGALRDMVQNHMLQLLALVAMEPPAKFDAAAVRDEKVKVLRALRPLDRNTVASHTVRGQYGPGIIGGAPVPGYAEELGAPSNVETFVAMKEHVDNWRW
jgi:glucose-6-phosphate 1-dehydrogenase